MTAKCQRGYDFKNHESLCAAFNLALLKAGKVLVEKREGISHILEFCYYTSEGYRWVMNAKNRNEKNGRCFHLRLRVGK